MQNTSDTMVILFSHTNIQLFFLGDVADAMANVIVLKFLPIEDRKNKHRYTSL